jgi:hypothetical protein
MFLLHPTLPTQERPRGVVAIAALCGVFSVVAFTFAGLLFAGVVPLSAGAFLLGGGMEQVGPFAFILYGAILATLGVALWRRWKGSRRVAIVVAGAGIALAVPAVSSAVADGRVFAIVREGVQVMFRVVIIFYLSQEPVKEWFANRELQLANAGRSDDTTQHNRSLE